VSIKSRIQSLIVGIAGLANMFATAALERSSWNYRGGTQRKRSRHGSSKKANAAGSSKKRHRGKFCKAAPAIGHRSSRPSYKHPHALCARPAPNTLNHYEVCRDERVAEIMSKTQPFERAAVMACQQFNATPFLGKTDAQLEYAGTAGNNGPTFGKRLRRTIARGERRIAGLRGRELNAEIAKVNAARKRLAAGGAP
jgi:hypothetical protein